MAIESAVDLVRKAQVVGILEQVCQALELTPSQHELAKDRYEAVGRWLAESPNALATATIYPQGSVALGTTVKPLARDEHDVDLICFVPGLDVNVPPARLKYAIGQRLRDNGHYRDHLEEMARCWRLNYPNDFHLDITPSIKNSSCFAGGELVPDKTVNQWKPSNPRGYKGWFEEQAQLRPRIHLAKAALTEEARAEVQPFPEPARLKGILRRAVQLLKRHRDIHFERLDPEVRPISIILTTLAARSYAHCVTVFEYQSELDVLNDVVRLIPSFIEERLIQGRKQWFVWNDTTAGENFAEKWNRDSRRAEAFFGWHARATADVDGLIRIAGLDRLTKSLKESFGDVPVGKVMREMTDRVSSARRDGRLAVSASVGLAAGTGIATSVRANTFFGRR